MFMITNQGENDMKSKISIFLSLFFIFIGCTLDTDKEYEYGHFLFKHIDKQSVSFCGLNSEAKLSGTLYIPETIYGLNVVKIEGGEYGSNYKDIVSIVIPSTVRTIGDNAFQRCEDLAEISTPDGVTTIGNKAFMDCSSLKEITLPASVKEIGESAFENCKALASFIADKTAITEIKARTFAYYNYFLYLDNGYSVLKQCLLPPSLTSIGKSAFENCKRLENIAIPDKVVTIEKEAFKGCFSLKEITLPASVKSIGENAFEDCKALASFNAGETVITEIKARTFYNCTSLENFSFPPTIKVIGNQAFSHSGIPGFLFDSDDQLVSIGFGSFEYCSKLKEIIFPLALKSIANNVFEGCSALNSVTFADTNSWYVQRTSSSTWTSVTVTNPAANAQYLKNIYKDFYWSKKH